MFKLFFLSLMNIDAHEINLALIKAGKMYTRPNSLTVTIYHKLFTKRK